jgi:transcriptional regulator GlxA family with amidase domain
MVHIMSDGIHSTPFILLMKGGHLMDLLKNMNDAMRCIEDNLTNEIDFKIMARIAHCSEYHFKRMFSFLAGVHIIRIHSP